MRSQFVSFYIRELSVPITFKVNFSRYLIYTVSQTGKIEFHLYLINSLEMLPLPQRQCNVFPLHVTSKLI